MHQVSRLLNAIFVNEGSQNDRSLQQTRNRRSMPRRASGQELSHSQSSHSHSQSQEQECTQPSSTPTRPKKPVNFPKFVKNQIDDIDTEVIVVNISRTQYEVVEEVALELGWRVEKSKKSQKWDIMWIDSHIEAHDLFKLNEHQKISHFPAIYVLTRKNYLGRNLMKMRNLFPEDYRFFPSTWSVPSDLTELLRFDEKLRAKQGSAFYIYKPEAMAQGKGIKLYQNVELLQGKTGIVQQYINNPYLIEGLKFDLRIYVLIMGYDPLRIFIYDEGLGRFATENYEKVRKKNMKDVHMHLTNYAINKNSKNFIFNHSQKSMDKGHKRSLSAIYSYLGSQNVDVARLKASIDEMIVKTLIVGQPMIAHTYGLAQSDTYANDLCFQILGFDVLINDQLQPILLEVNHTPSFTTDTPLDKFIKKSLIKDTLNLLNVNVESKKEKVGMKKEHIELRAQRKLTKLTTEEKEDLRSKKWKERDLYELANLGNFRKIYPTPQSSKYNEMVQASTRIFNEINGIKNKNQCKMVLTSRPRSLERCNIRQSAESNVVAPTRKKQPKGFKIKKTISVRQSGSKFPTISANKKIERIYESPSSRKQQLINKSNQKLERATSYFRNEKAECQLEGELFARGSFVAPKMLEMNETQAQQRSMQLVNCTIMNSPNRNQIFYKVRNFEDIVNEASVQMSGLSQTKKSNFENLLNSLSSSSYYRPDIKQFRPSK